jgi:hypothetical protein
MATTVGHMIFYVAMFIVVMIAIYILIQVVVTQVAFWILRPSEMASLDLVGAVSALGGTTGEVTAEYRTYTGNVTYYVKKTEKIICVISQRKQTEDMPLVGGIYVTFNCFSTPFVPQFDFGYSSMESYEFNLVKSFQDPLVVVEKR